MILTACSNIFGSSRWSNVEFIVALDFFRSFRYGISKALMWAPHLTHFFLEIVHTFRDFHRAKMIEKNLTTIIDLSVYNATAEITKQHLELRYWRLSSARTSLFGGAADHRRSKKLLDFTVHWRASSDTLTSYFVRYAWRNNRVPEKLDSTHDMCLCLGFRRAEWWSRKRNYDSNVMEGRRLLWSVGFLTRGIESLSG